MPKAKLTTRERTTSNVSTDNLNKGSELSFAEADSNFINLRDASFGIADDSSTVLQVTDDKTITIAGGTNVTTALSGDTLTINAASSTGDLTIDTYTNSDFGVDTVRLQVPAGEDLELNAGTGGGPGGSGDRLIKMMDRVKFFKELNSDGSNGNLHFAPNGTGLIQHYTAHTGYTFPRVTGDEQGKVLVMGGIDGSSVNQLGFSNVLDNLSTMKAGDVKIIDNTISTQSSNANLELDASGTGKVVISGLVFPNSDGSAGQVISTDGSGNLSFTSAVAGSFTASSIDTFTNKTFDVEGTGNSISNIDVADLKSGVLDTDLSSVSGSDDTLASAKAIKTYVDAQGGGVSLSGSTNNTVATVTGSNALAGEANLTFDGSTLAVTGAATVSTTLGVTGASTLDGVTITDNTISTNASNANLELDGSGSGKVSISGIKHPTSDGSAGQVLQTDGSGNLSFATVSGGGGSAITIQDEGSSLSTAATTINFVGAGVAASGTGATKTITIGASNANTGDFVFSGNKMSTSSSNADMEFEPAGTGQINLDAEILIDKFIGTNGDSILIAANSQSETDHQSNGEPFFQMTKVASGGNAQINVPASKYIYLTTDGRTGSNGIYLNNDVINLYPKGSGRVNFKTQTSTTIGSNGSASALTSNPVGYIKIQVNDQEYQIPYYNQ